MINRQTRLEAHKVYQVWLGQPEKRLIQILARAERALTISCEFECFLSDQISAKIGPLIGRSGFYWESTCRGRGLSSSSRVYCIRYAWGMGIWTTDLWHEHAYLDFTTEFHTHLL